MLTPFGILTACVQYILNVKTFPAPLVEQHEKTPLGVAARADEVVTVDMIIKAERYNVWKAVRIAPTHRSSPTSALCTCH